MKRLVPLRSFWGSYPSEVQALAQRARGLLLKLLPGVQEGAPSYAPVLGYSYGPGYRGMVCTLILSKSGARRISIVRLSSSWLGSRARRGNRGIHRCRRTRRCVREGDPDMHLLFQPSWRVWDQCDVSTRRFSTCLDHTERWTGAREASFLT
jgi:hypothetical protein